MKKIYSEIFCHQTSWFLRVLCCFLFCFVLFLLISQTQSALTHTVIWKGKQTDSSCVNFLVGLHLFTRLWFVCLFYAALSSGSWMCWCVMVWESTVAWRPWPGCQWSPTSGRACGTFLHTSTTQRFLLVGLNSHCLSVQDLSHSIISLTTVFWD